MLSSEITIFTVTSVINQKSYFDGVFNANNYLDVMQLIPSGLLTLQRALQH